MQRGLTMATVTSSQPLSFELLSGFTTEYCIEKIVASAAQSEFQTQTPQGLLIVGCGSQPNLQENWLRNIINQWEIRTALNQCDSLPGFYTFTEGSSLSKVIRKCRSTGSLLPVQKLLMTDAQPVDDSNDRSRLFIITRFDCISRNESDQFLASQCIDFLLGNSSLLIVTLPSHPTTLGLHPALASRLCAGFLLPIPTHTSFIQKRLQKSSTSTASHESKIQISHKKLQQKIDRKTTDVIKKIIQNVARHFGILPDDITGGSQRRCHVRPRGFAMYCVREMTNLSSHEIGRNFGGRDHSTVLHSLKVTTKILQQDQNALADLHEITSTLQNTKRC